MPSIPDESIHLTFTSPPYFNARTYSQYPTYQHYLDFLKKVFRQIHRITKEGRFLVINSSPIIDTKQDGKRYAIPFDMHRDLEEMGWEFVDDIIWRKPEWIGVNRNAKFAKHRRPLSYKPNTVTEYVMIYRKKTNQPVQDILKQYPKEIIEASKVKDGFESANIWELYPASHPVHSAVFPSKLAQRVIEYYSLKGDLVFDPFGGSGTLGRVATTLGRPFLMAEKDDKYFNFIKSKANTSFKNVNAKFVELTEFEKSETNNQDLS